MARHSDVSIECSVYLILPVHGCYLWFPHRFFSPSGSCVSPSDLILRRACPAAHSKILFHMETTELFMRSGLLFPHGSTATSCCLQFTCRLCVCDDVQHTGKASSSKAAQDIGEIGGYKRRGTGSENGRARNPGAGRACSFTTCGYVSGKPASRKG